MFEERERDGPRKGPADEAKLLREHEETPFVIQVPVVDSIRQNASVAAIIDTTFAQEHIKWDIKQRQWLERRSSDVIACQRRVITRHDIGGALHARLRYVTSKKE